MISTLPAQGSRPTLGAYEKQVILELDQQLTLEEAQVFTDKHGARILFCIITDSWEREHTVAECLPILLATRLLLFRGYVPTTDAIATLIQQNKHTSDG